MKLEQSLSSKNLQDYKKNLQGRLVRSSTPITFTIEPSEQSLNSIIPEGSMTFILGLNGSRKINEIKSLISEKRFSELKDYLVDLKDQINKRKNISIDEAIECLSSLPNTGELKYNQKTIVVNAPVLDNEDVTIYVCAYNGGNLNKDEFKLVDYYKEGAAEKLDGIIILNKPLLTETELEALELVPSDQTHLNVESFLLCYAACGAAAAMAVAALCVAISAYQPEIEDQLKNKISEIDFDGSLKSIADLTSIREEFLKQID